MVEPVGDRWQPLEVNTRNGTLLELVKPTERGTRDLVADVMDARQMQFMHVPAFTEASAATAFLNGMLVEPGMSFNWLLHHEGATAGWACLFAFEHDMCELGYFVRSHYAGRGFATAAAWRVTHFAHTVLDVRRLNASADPRNVASHRVLASSGFTHEGTQRANFRYGSAWQDTALFGRLRTDPLPDISLEQNT